MNVIDVEPKPLTENSLLEDSRRIKEENKREMKHELHIDGCIQQHGTVEAYMIHLHPEYRDMIQSRLP